ncbi:EboA domain-containing protein [Dactylosporangium sp. AC04546]|uniref:EboA domain-containing protein n=1 Tax=Dactylosporangium sp. AC04546 TaxID=2862460 RepID=UPI001EDE45EC|nr:EboA domain-containing protein [Dactylosporangium sp. AC04546]WVK85816.1 EboA domain-containing protein [Dactylosporangium sp. AC04546]
MNPPPFYEILAAELPDTVWLDTALETVSRQPASVARLFPAAGRQCGRWGLTGLPAWTVDDAARALLLTRLPAEAVAAELESLYRYGDGAEKRAVLRALPWLEVRPEVVRELLLDALRTNDTRLVAAALGPAARHLPVAAWRQGVLKAVFMGLPLDGVADLDERADGELATMLAGLAEERHAAGRTMPGDATELLHRLREEVS